MLRHMGYRLYTPKVTKLGSEFITQPLTFIINISLNESIIIDSSKLAKVIPIFNSGNP